MSKLGREHLCRQRILHKHADDSVSGRRGVVEVAGYQLWVKLAVLPEAPGPVGRAFIVDPRKVVQLCRAVSEATSCNPGYWRRQQVWLAEQPRAAKVSNDSRIAGI